MLKKLYDEKKLLFSLIWIFAYVVIIGNIRGTYGDGSPQMFTALLVYALLLLLFVYHYKLQQDCGLDCYAKDSRKYLYFIPMWILACGNLFDGFSLPYQGKDLLYASLSMALVGFIEEMIFRAFLFKALLKQDGEKTAIIISSLTFGMGHIMNLFTGQDLFETGVQILFAIAWGFIFTMVYYRGKSLWPCIIAHAMIDVFSLYGGDNVLMDWFYIILTILTAIIYGGYLYKMKE